MRQAGGAVAVDAGPARPEATLPRSLRVERLCGLRMGEHRAAWDDLCRRALEANAFLEPGFALALATRLARRFVFLTVWEQGAPGRSDRLVGLLPVRRGGPFGRLRGFEGKLVAAGTPLLDRDAGAAAFAAMLDALARDVSRPAALTLTAVQRDGAFMETIVAHLGRHPVRVVAAHSRAVLLPLDGARTVLSLQSAKSRKEQKRQRRRLMECGDRAYVSASTPAEVATATESFLALEQRGWKGGRGTALLSRPAPAAFVRAMTRDMARDGKCRIDALELDGRAIAMGIVLTSGDRAYFWKTAFDEAFASLSPGVQLTLDLTDAQLADKAVALTDSCAVPDHPMIDRLWPERMEVVDLAIGLRRGGRGLARAVATEWAARAARAGAKRVLAWPNLVRRVLVRQGRAFAGRRHG